LGESVGVGVVSVAPAVTSQERRRLGGGAGGSEA
jgi:hypothetical protein